LDLPSLDDDRIDLVGRHCSSICHPRRPICTRLGHVLCTVSWLHMVYLWVIMLTLFEYMSS